MSDGLQFVLVSETTSVAPADLYWLARLAEMGARDCAQAHQRTPPAIDAFDSVLQIPFNDPNVIPVRFVDRNPDPSLLAVHTWDPIRRAPVARVYCEGAPGVLTGQDCLLARLTHEINETLIDPLVNLWRPCPGRPDVEVAEEVSDPVQTIYGVVYGTTVGHVANFVTPWWFDGTFADPTMAAALLARGERFDHSGELTRAGAIGPEGYAIVRQHDPVHGWTVWPVDAGGARPSWSPEKVRAKQHPSSRTYTRGVRVGIET